MLVLLLVSHANCCFLRVLPAQRAPRVSERAGNAFPLRVPLPLRLRPFGAFAAAAVLSVRGLGAEAAAAALAAPQGGRPLPGDLRTPAPGLKLPKRPAKLELRGKKEAGLEP